MAYIKPEFIDRLIADSDIVAVIGQFVDLKKAGSSYKGCCPFHGEKTPSFHVSPDKGVYHCFGCKAAGGVIQFLRDHLHLDYIGAVQRLAALSNREVEYDTTRQGSYSQAEQKALVSHREQMHELMDKVSQYYESCLHSENGRQAAEYAYQKRRIAPDMIALYRIGYSPANRISLTDFFAASKGTEAVKQQKRLLLDTGIISPKIKNEDDVTKVSSDLPISQYYPFFRDRLMFPILNERGRVVGFGARSLEAKPKAKYINSSNGPIYNKSEEVYGLYQAIKKRKGSKPLDELIVVEGYLDVVALAQYGYPVGVAASGTSMTSRQIQKLFKHTDNVVFCLDGDAAGQNAKDRIIFEALPVLKNGKDVRFAFLTDGEDPDSFLHKYGLEKFQFLIRRQSLSILDVIFSTVSSKVKYDNKTKFILEIFEYYKLLGEDAAMLRRDLLEKLEASNFGSYARLQERFAELKKAEEQRQEEKISYNTNPEIQKEFQGIEDAAPPAPYASSRSVTNPKLALKKFKKYYKKQYSEYEIMEEVPESSYDLSHIDTDLHVRVRALMDITNLSYTSFWFQSIVKQETFLSNINLDNIALTKTYLDLYNENRKNFLNKFVITTVNLIETIATNFALNKDNVNLINRTISSFADMGILGTIFMKFIENAIEQIVENPEINELDKDRSRNYILADNDEYTHEIANVFDIIENRVIALGYINKGIKKEQEKLDAEFAKKYENYPEDDPEKEVPKVIQGIIINNYMSYNLLLDMLKLGISRHRLKIHDYFLIYEGKVPEHIAEEIDHLEEEIEIFMEHLKKYQK